MQSDDYSKQFYDYQKRFEDYDHKRNSSFDPYSNQILSPVDRNGDVIPAGVRTDLPHNTIDLRNQKLFGVKSKRKNFNHLNLEYPHQHIDTLTPEMQP